MSGDCQKRFFVLPTPYTLCKCSLAKAYIVAPFSLTLVAILCCLINT